MSDKLVESELTEAEKAECRKWSAGTERQEFLDKAALTLMPVVIQLSTEEMTYLEVAGTAYKFASALWVIRQGIIKEESEDE